MGDTLAAAKTALAEANRKFPSPATPKAEQKPSVVDTVKKFVGEHMPSMSSMVPEKSSVSGVQSRLEQPGIKEAAAAAGVDVSKAPYSLARSQ